MHPQSWYGAACQSYRMFLKIFLVLSELTNLLLQDVMEKKYL